MKNIKQYLYLWPILLLVAWMSLLGYLFYFLHVEKNVVDKGTRYDHLVSNMKEEVGASCDMRAVPKEKEEPAGTCNIWEAGKCENNDLGE